MYSFARRDDFTVLDEPFYGAYLQQAKLDIAHPERELILESMELNEKEIIDNINRLSQTKNIFVKGMAHHYLSRTPDFILDWENVILIRHPKKLIASFSKVIATPSLNDIGIKMASELFLFLKHNGKIPVVIDSDELLVDPKNYLKSLCALLNISFLKDMLSWKKGGISDDGIWASHWYKNVHNSEGFVLQESSSQPLPKKLQPLLEEAMPHYETLNNYTLKNS
jgi:hypothetical protein